MLPERKQDVEIIGKCLLIVVRGEDIRKIHHIPVARAMQPLRNRPRARSAVATTTSRKELTIMSPHAVSLILMCWLLVDGLKRSRSSSL